MLNIQVIDEGSLGTESKPATAAQASTEESGDELKKPLLKPIMGPMEIS